MLFRSVEKPAIMLVGYAKTGELAPGASETVSVTFEKEQLKAYDSANAKTYILDAGDYYVTAAANAHAAVNNVLAAKGFTTADGMTEDGDAAFVETYTVSALDSDTYAVDSYSGAPVTNLFDHARGDVSYLTRNDWTGTFPVHDGEPSDIVSTWGGEINGADGVAYTWKKTASAALIAQLDSFESNSPVDPVSFTDTPVYGAKNGLTLIEMRGLDFDDPLWEKLLDQLTEKDYYETIGLSGYGIEYIDSVNKPFTIDADTAGPHLWRNRQDVPQCHDPGPDLGPGPGPGVRHHDRQRSPAGRLQRLVCPLHEHPPDPLLRAQRRILL